MIPIKYDASKNRTGSSNDLHYGNATVLYNKKEAAWVMHGGRLMNEFEARLYLMSLSNLLKGFRT